MWLDTSLFVTFISSYLSIQQLDPTYLITCFFSNWR